MKARDLKILSVDGPYLERLSKTNPNQYAVAAMWHLGLELHSIKEIATALNIPEGTVKSRLNRGRLQIIKWREIDEKAKAVAAEQTRGATENV